MFADWLLERGDPRGEIIASSARAEVMSELLSLSDRRRLASLTERHAREWLGPLIELAELGQCRFEGGFLSHLACQAPVRSDAWARLEGEVRLATVTGLALPAGRESGALGAFVRHPVLRHLRRLHATAAGWSLLDTAGLSLEVVSLGSWGVFRGELEAVRGRRARTLELVTSEFVNPLVALEVRESVLAEQNVLAPFEEVSLVVRFGVVEGAAAWLVRAGADGLPLRWKGSVFGLEYGDTRFSLRRDGSAFNHLVVDLGHRGDPAGLGQRLATAASVLVQLGAARLERVEVKLPAGARLRASERDALRAAARRLGSIKSFSLGGAPLAP